MAKDNGINFKEIEDRLTPSETIDSMIHHLNLIKGDIEDKYNSKEALISSIEIRNCGLQTLNILLTDYLAQHKIQHI